VTTSYFSVSSRFRITSSEVADVILTLPSIDGSILPAVYSLGVRWATRNLRISANNANGIWIGGIGNAYAWGGSGPLLASMDILIHGHVRLHLLPCSSNPIPVPDMARTAVDFGLRTICCWFLGMLVGARTAA